MNGVFPPFENALNAFHAAAPGAVTPVAIRAGAAVLQQFRAWAGLLPGGPPPAGQMGVEQYAGVAVEPGGDGQHVSVRGIIRAGGVPFEWPD
jgi:hypothetical protein